MKKTEAMTNASFTMNDKGVVLETDAPSSPYTLVIPKEATGFTISALECIGALNDIRVEEGNARYRAECGCLINRETETVIYAVQGATVPDGVKVIGNCAFNWQPERTETDMNPFRLPDGLRKIAYRAFVIDSENKIHIIIPASVEYVGIMALMIRKCGGDGICEVTFLGDPELETGVFGTKAELDDVEYILIKRGMIDGEDDPELCTIDRSDVHRKMPGVLYPKPENYLIHAPEGSSVAAYCAEYGIPCKTFH